MFNTDRYSSISRVVTSTPRLYSQRDIFIVWCRETIKIACIFFKRVAKTVIVLLCKNCTYSNPQVIRRMAGPKKISVGHRLPMRYFMYYRLTQL